MSSFLTKEQLDKYVKDLASKTPKTTSSKNTQSKSPPVSKVSLNSPLSSPITSYSSISAGERKVGGLHGPRSPTTPNSPLSSPTTSYSSISTGERKAGGLYGPRSPPSSNRNSLTATISPRGSIISNNKYNENNSGPSLNEIKETKEIKDATGPITQNSASNNDDSSLDEIKVTEFISQDSFSIHKPTEPQDSISNDSSTISSNLNNHEEKKSNYKSIDDIVNDLSYPMETKLSFKPTTPPPQSKVNNSAPSQKGADEPPKGSYVLSAAFRSYNAASRTPSIKKPVIQPSPKQEQREISLNKKQRDSTIQELQNRSDTNWNARYDEAQQKFPPLSKLDEEITTSPSFSQIPNKNDVTGRVSPPQNSKPLTPSASNSGQTIRPTSISSLSCAACGKSISGNVLNAMGKKWHPDHFVCKHCGITLEHVAFFEHDGNPYCHLDFHELFSPRCGYCETPIEGQVMNALGKSWHPDHFFCRECGNTFENGYMVHEGFPYCEKDWMKLFAPKCKGCGSHIKGEFTNASGGMWHRDCFGCTTCKKPFDSSYYYVFDGKPYCEQHYREILS